MRISILSVHDIVNEYLEQNGYDGLYDPYGDCSCEKGDLAPCGNIGGDCEPGYKTQCVCGEGHDFHIAPMDQVEGGTE